MKLSLFLHDFCQALQRRYSDVVASCYSDEKLRNSVCTHVPGKGKSRAFQLQEHVSPPFHSPPCPGLLREVPVKALPSP